MELVKLGIVVAFLPACLLPGQNQPAAPAFNLTDLGLLPGAKISQATAISDSGIVTGYSGSAFSVSNGNNGGRASGSAQGFIYSNGVMSGISGATAVNGSAAAWVLPLGVSDSGELAGDAESPGAFQPIRFVYENGEYQTLTLPTAIYFFAMNNAGQVAGGGDLTPGLVAPCIWQNGVVTTLPVAGHSGWAQGISSNGEMAAGDNFTESLSGPAAYVLPIVWTNGQPQLAALPSGFDNGAATSVNDTGQAAGLVFQANQAGYNFLEAATTAPPTSAVIMTGGKTTLIPPLPGAVASLAMGINDNGWVVGYGIDDATDFYEVEYLGGYNAVVPANADRHAFLWVGGSTYDLTSLVANAPGWQLTSALGINSSGQIVGSGLIGGEQHAYLLTPISSVLPQFAFGGGWYSALYFTNLTGSPVSFPVNFVSSAGTALDVPSVGGSTEQVNLAANGTAIIEAPNAGSLVQGYPAFTLPDGVFGYGVFRQSAAGRADQEAVVPLSDAGATSNTLTWDDTNLITAVSVVNPSATANTAAVTLWDQNGAMIGTSSITLPPNSKTAATLRSLPGLSGMVGQRGSAQFSVSSGSVAVLGLRFDGPAFTSIPTTTSSAVASSRSSVLPQFAFGGGWYSALYFTNLTGSPVSFPVNLVSDAGTPLAPPVQVSLAANGTVIIEAPNVGDLQQGYAAFTLPSGVFGYGVFRQSVAGRPDQEAVVPLSDAGATSNTLTWDETSLITAVSIVNPSSTATTVAVTLWDESGKVIGTSSVALPANSKTAATLRSLPGLSGMVGLRGSAQFSVKAGNVAVLGLRFDGPAFTSIPTTTPPAGAAFAATRSSLAR